VIGPIAGQNDQRPQTAARETTSQSTAQTKPSEGSGSAVSKTSLVDGSKRYLTAGGISSAMSDDTLFTLMQLGNKARDTTNEREKQDDQALLTKEAAQRSETSKNAYLAGQRKVKPVFDLIEKK
jgi:hypothetical protein